MCKLCTICVHPTAVIARQQINVAFVGVFSAPKGSEEFLQVAARIQTFEHSGAAGSYKVYSVHVCLEYSDMMDAVVPCCTVSCFVSYRCVALTGSRPTVHDVRCCAGR